MKQTLNPRIYVERTLAIVKPDAVHRAEEIEEAILESGFTIVQKRTLQLSPEQCSDFYADQYGKLSFPSLTAFMSSGPIIALTLACHDAIARWKSIMGPGNSIQAREIHPESLRAKYGTNELKNALHGSETIHAAVREIKFIFPNTVIEPVPSREDPNQYLSRLVNPTLLHGLTEVCRHKPYNPCLWLANWLIKNNPNMPKISNGPLVEEAE
ncbi:nucleoside diphosphate kinase homolog 5 [Brachionichthys hirsutus]|uniref:nucleoside diphosphate kinase homolog 5 n=1 Tax=Brachionichthys hirsutus TaxID=412623 RepID=UPI0036047CDA